MLGEVISAAGPNHMNCCDRISRQSSTRVHHLKVYKNVFNKNLKIELWFLCLVLPTFFYIYMHLHLQFLIVPISYIGKIPISLFIQWLFSWPDIVGYKTIIQWLKTNKILKRYCWQSGVLNMRWEIVEGLLYGMSGIFYPPLARKDFN